MELNDITGEVVRSAMKVHTALGPGLLESAYRICLGHELRRRGLVVEREVRLPVNYDGLQIDVGYRIDLLVEGQVIVEVKAVSRVHPLHTAQLLSYLRLSGLRVGLLLNFCVRSMRHGIRRMVN
jgi:GxxExxY protein